MNIALIIILTVVLTLFAILARKYDKISKAHSQKQEEYKKLLSQKKSSEVVLGQISEKLVPFLDMFPYDPQKASFLGNPIDYVVFDDDEVVFVEIKSGNSRLSPKQRKIKKLINDGKVRWEEIKIKP